MIKHTIFSFLEAQPNPVISHIFITMKEHAQRPIQLYLIPTPISESGEWQLPKNVIDALLLCTTLVCERIRTTRRLIRKYYSQEAFDALQFIEMGKHNQHDYVQEALQALSNQAIVAVLSEAGMPCIADPGHELVLAAHKKGLTIHPFPGPCSFLMALMSSGLNGQAFTFHGYLPREQDELQSALHNLEKSVKRDGSSHVFMETPYRNQKLFESVIHSVSDHLLLHVSLDINGKNEQIKTTEISNWKKKPFKFKEKYPAVFILGAK